MPGKIAWMTILSLLLCGSASAGSQFDFNYGHNERDHRRHEPRHHGGAWTDHGRHHGGGPQGHWGAGHGHFSPRGQGGHHWGW